jgi:pimeloyl-ACP methyl ester carboxylesterase
MKIATHRIPGLVLSDHCFTIPLDHANPNAEQLEVFAREVVAPGREDDNLPWLVFLQGGPGSPSPRPLGRDGWIRRALQEYRVLLLDQRGTGLSSPVTPQTLARFKNPQAVADYLKFFRADAIVRDAEAIRYELVGDGEPWTILGQSYGGFCALTYLSLAPHALVGAIITGGLPSTSRPPDDVYRATYKRVLANNRQYFERYPEDAERAQTLGAYLLANDVRLPTGDRLTARRLQLLGHDFGATDGMESVHYLLEQAFVRGASGDEPGYTFLRGVENAQRFDTNPIYAILHEAIYAQGQASHWSAERVRAEYPEFDFSPGKPFQFTGEMIYPWMFEEFAALRPLKEAADILAEYADWPLLYDADGLRANEVPVAAAIYYDDMYVERAFSEETAQTIRGSRTWITNEHQHNAIRAHGEAVLGKLLGMLKGE